MKLCSKCGNSKSYAMFSRNKTRADGFQNHCKNCVAEYDRVYRRAHSGELYAQKKVYIQRNHDAFVVRRKTYAKKNQEQLNRNSARYVAANRELHYARVKRWAASNKHLVAAKDARHRAARKNATPPWVRHEDFAPIYRLAIDASELTGTQYHVDHIVPLCGKKVSGLHVPWNLRVIPAVINRRKGNHLIEELAHA